MADTKISGLPASTTPLAGTEVLPIVQSSSTVQVSVANLTAGRAVATGALTVTGTLSATGATGTAYLVLNAPTDGGYASFQVGAATFADVGSFKGIIGTGSASDLYIGTRSTNNLTFGTAFVERMRLDSSGNLLVGGTATTGSASNSTIVAGGKFKTVSGSVSAADNTATTLFTAPTALAAWLVTINVDADSVLYAATYVINTQGGSSTVATLLYKGTLVSISVSGYSVQATQTSGGTATIQYSAVRIF